MKLNKFGDCLSYGLTHELLDKKQSLGLSYFKTVIVYMFLKKYMCSETVRKIRKVISAGQYGNMDSKVLFENVLKLVAGELRKHFSFSTIEELFEVLNKEIVPEWIYRNYDKLFALLPEVCWLGKYLFFVEYKEPVHVLNKVWVEAIRGNALSCDEIDDEYMRVISYTYSKIIGSNETLGILYLQPANLFDMYAEYCVESNQERIHRNKCLGKVGNMLIIEDKGFLTVKAGKKLNRIKRLDPFESYEFIENEIYVTPKKEKPIYFKPYKLSLKGCELQVSYSEAKGYLWEELQDERSGLFKKYLISSIVEENKSDFDEFTLGNIEDYYKKLTNLESDRNARVCYFLIKILHKYMEREVDVLDYFYMFMDVSKRYDENTWSTGINERLYWRIEELEARGELEGCIYNIEKLKAALLEDAFWDDKRVSKEKTAELTSCKGKIGEFNLIKGNVDANAVNVKDGYYWGNTFLYSIENRKGTVSYDVNLDRYTIRYPRILKHSEVERIVDAFDLEYENYHVVIEENSLLIN